MKLVWVSVKCDDYYKLINKIRDLISISEIIRKKDYIFLKITEKDLKKLKKYIVSYEFIIIKNTGLTHIKNIFLKNKLLIITTILGIILFFLLNSIIVNVEIIHENIEIRKILEEELELSGIKNFSIKKNYEELQIIKENLKNKYPNLIDWIEIEVVGQKYIIRLEERIIVNNDEKNENNCDVYAKKSGVIKEIYIESGVTSVKINDYVNEGDLLISKDIVEDEENKSEICAKGTIIAENWYESKITYPFMYTKKIFYDETRINFIYEYEEKEKKILNDRLTNYESKKILLINLFNHQIYLEYQKSMEEKKFFYTETEVIDKAFLLNYENISLKLDEGDEIIFQKTLKKIVNDSTIEIDIFTVTNEVIS